MRLLGAVLAGGQSRRFGSDKAVAAWRGQALIDHVIAALRPQVAAVVVCGRTMLSETCLPDRPAPDLGPLGGLNAALAYAVANGFDAVLSVPCDTPLLPADLAARLGEGGARYLAELPVIGCWPAGLADALDRHLAAGGSRAVRRWAEIAGAVPVALPPDALPANINAPDDLAAL